MIAAERSRGEVTPDLCPSCGQALPASGRLTRRELDVLVAWWMVGSVKQAAVVVKVGEQRAKNLLHRARIRNAVHSNEQLLAMHFAAVRSAVSEHLSHNGQPEEAAS